MEHVPGSYTGPSHFSFCKRQLFTEHLKKVFKSEVSVTDTEVSGWVVNSLKTFLSEQQTILGSAVQADRDGDGDVSGINICYPKDQHGQKGGSIPPGDCVSILRVSSAYIEGTKSVARYQYGRYMCGRS